MATTFQMIFELTQVLQWHSFLIFTLISMSCWQRAAWI